MNDVAQLSDEEIQKELRIRKNRKQIDTLATRYGDAYLVARGVTAFGSTIKGIGALIGIVLAVGGFVAANQGRGEGVAVGILAIGLGIVVAALFYVIGILVSSQGQILKASLDSAVNSSPFLENEHRSKIMSLS